MVNSGIHKNHEPPNHPDYVHENNESWLPTVESITQ